jgi:hypothetical protein
MFTAHDVADGKLWELREDDKKIGFIHITPRGYTVKANGLKAKYKDLNDLNIKFKKIVFVENSVPEQVSSVVPLQADYAVSMQANSVYGYPCDAEPYNDIWDVQQKIPLYTKTEKSKTFYCAGYYVTQELEILFCPKRMILQRGVFVGPFKSESQARGFDE